VPFLFAGNVNIHDLPNTLIRQILQNVPRTILYGSVRLVDRRFYNFAWVSIDEKDD
jgi:hypothetical protein